MAQKQKWGLGKNYERNIRGGETGSPTESSECALACKPCLGKLFMSITLPPLRNVLLSVRTFRWRWMHKHYTGGGLLKVGCLHVSSHPCPFLPAGQFFAPKLIILMKCLIDVLFFKVFQSVLFTCFNVSLYRTRCDFGIAIMFRF